MIDVIYSGNAALKREYEERYDYPVLVYSREDAYEDQVYTEEKEQNISWKQAFVAAIGFLLVGICPPIGALLLWGASKAPH